MSDAIALAVVVGFAFEAGDEWLTQEREIPGEGKTFDFPATFRKLR